MAEELSPEESERLRQLREAFEQEFHESREATSSRAAIQDLEELKTDMLTSLKNIVRHSTDEKLKARVSMWGYTLLVNQGKTKADPLADLVNGAPSRVSSE